MQFHKGWLKRPGAIWSCRKRLSLFKLPWTTTKYTVIGEMLFIQEGIFPTRYKRVLLRKIEDFRVEKTTVQRMFGLGNIRVITLDENEKDFVIMGIENPDEVRKDLNTWKEEARRENAIRLKRGFDDLGDMEETSDEEEENSSKLIWEGPKRWSFLGLPWTTTKYKVSTDEIEIQYGWFPTKHDYILLRLVKDSMVTINPIQRLFYIGNIIVDSTDKLVPKQVMKGIILPLLIDDMLWKYVEEARFNDVEAMLKEYTITQ